MPFRPFDNLGVPRHRPCENWFAVQESLQIIRKLIRCRVTLCLVFFKAFEADGLQIQRNSFNQGLGRHRLLVANIFQGLQQGCSFKGRPSREELVKHGTQGINIRQWSNFLGLAACLLRWHVTGRTHNGTRPGLSIVGVHFLGQTKVRDLAHTILGNQHVGRFQVAVNDLHAMGISHASGKLHHHPCRPFGRLG